MTSTDSKINERNHEATEATVEKERAENEAMKWLGEATGSEKCWPCGCLHGLLAAIEQATTEGTLPELLVNTVREAKGRLTDTRYDCLGCEVCFPALVINALNEMGIELSGNHAVCPTEQVRERNGWPPLPGNYVVLRYRAPVAICTLTDEVLFRKLADDAMPEMAVVGTLQTENLGIERLLINVLANPNIRFVLLCGQDSRQAVGHLPGQSLIQLACSGIDSKGRIIGAKGKRPIIRNVSPEAVEYFRKSVDVVDLVGVSDSARIMEAVRLCADRYPGPAEPYILYPPIAAVAGSVPERMTPDPKGYFIIYVDRTKGMLSMEHYQNDGMLDAVIEGHTAAEIYSPAIDRGFVSRLDHAAYLGRELARAEHALESGEPYVQDGAPEMTAPSSDVRSCNCASSCYESLRPGREPAEREQ